MIKNIPSQNTKKWLTSFRGDFWGDIINMFNLDLFSAQGKARVGTKYYPHTTEIDPPSSMTEAEIYDGADYPNKVWAVSGNREIYRSTEDGLDEFELDASTGIPTNDDTGEWSDLTAVPDESEEPITAVEISIPAGDGAISITGDGNNTKWAQSFTQVQGPFKSLSLYIKKVGSPTDNITLDIQSDSAGVPSGVSITSITVNATEFTTDFVSHTFEAEDFSDPTVQFDLDAVYHLVISRSGSADLDNYVKFQIAFAINDPDTDQDAENPYKHGELQNYNGTTWTRTVTFIKTDTFTADGSWTVPAGVTQATVETWAAGGAGITNTGGGGGGAYSRSVLGSLVAADVYDVAVGQPLSLRDGQDSIFNAIEYLVVAGGGGGGDTEGGGGGGGGVKSGFLGLQATSYAITVGAGGNGSTTSNAKGENGHDSSIAALVVALGGGGGGSQLTATGADGGNGGGGSNGGAGGAGAAGGFNGGTAHSTNGGGGGGGAGEVGSNGTSGVGGDGGDGVVNDITGSNVTYAGGGGGQGSSSGGAGGAGGGGNGAVGNGSNGTANTGGGGGAGDGNGGSGVVIIRYRSANFTATGGTITTDGAYKVHTFTTSGTFTITSIDSAGPVMAKGGRSATNGGTGGTAANGIGTTKYSGGGGSGGTGDRGGGGGAGDSGDGSTTGSEIFGQGGEINGGIGGGVFNTETYNAGRVPGGAGNSATGSGQVGARGEVRVSYAVTQTAGYAFTAQRSYGHSASSSDALEVPTGTMPGELLILIVGSNEVAAVSVTGWTLLEELTDLTSKVTQSILWKRATGDDNGSIVSGTTGFSWECWRIIDGDTPISTTQSRGNSTNADPPELLGLETGKYLLMAAASFNVEDPVDITAAPTNYESFIMQPEFFPNVDNRGARVAVAERHANVSSEDPGVFTSTTAPWVAATIAIPYLAQDFFMDLSMSLTIEFPESPERLYLTTHQDVKFLNQEDGIWQSLWMGVFGKDAMNEDYPHPMRLSEAGGVLFVGDENKLHSMTATGSAASDVQESRLIFPFNYYVNWIALTKSAVFIGLANKLGDDQPSLICYYEPFTEITRLFTITEGTTIGYEKDENCFIVDRAGQMRYYNGTAFAVYDYFPPYYNSEKMNLFHRNGVIEKDSITRFLWEGQYPYAAGIWTYDDGRLYHRHGFIFDETVLNSFGAIDPADSIQWMALYYSNFGYFAGAAVTDGNDQPVEGIFSDFRRTGVTVDENNRSFFKTIKLTSQQIDSIWQRIFAKIDDRRAGIQDGSVILKQRYQNSAIGEGYSAPVFDGTWTSDTTFTCDTADFVDAVDDGLIVAGDEVIVRAGMGAGLLAHISTITGTTTKTVTITEGLSAISSGTFTFSVENWRVIANRGLTGNQVGKQWIQVKAEVRDFIDIEELQISSKPNRTNEE